jgi:hypothetical protein
MSLHLSTTAAFQAIIPLVQNEIVDPNGMSKT